MIPHLERYDDASCIARWHVTVNNHLRKLLWPWYTRKGVHVEDARGKRMVMRSDPVKKDVAKALAFSNNGEDFSLFVDWVAGYTYDVTPQKKLGWVKVKRPAPLEVVNSLMNTDKPAVAVGIVWKHGIRRLEGKVFQLQS